MGSYRGFAFGGDITSIAKLVGMRATDAKLIHQRPALLQELEWKMSAPLRVEPTPRDPVTGAVLCFLDGKLYRIVVAYDRYRIEGMTVDDVIDAISETYGAARRPETELRLHSYFAEFTKVLARWEDATYAYDLVRTGDRTSFALVMYSKSVERLAQAAIQEAMRLDALDAPRKAQEAESKRLEQDRLALEKSRAANRPNFKP